MTLIARYLLNKNLESRMDVLQFVATFGCRRRQHQPGGLPGGYEERIWLSIETTDDLVLFYTYGKSKKNSIGHSA
jgi:hypothetical protein